MLSDGDLYIISDKGNVKNKFFLPKKVLQRIVFQKEEIEQLIDLGFEDSINLATDHDDLYRFTVFQYEISKDRSTLLACVEKTNVLLKDEEKNFTGRISFTVNTWREKVIGLLEENIKLTNEVIDKPNDKLILSEINDNLEKLLKRDVSDKMLSELKRIKTITTQVIKVDEKPEQNKDNRIVESVVKID